MSATEVNNKKRIRRSSELTYLLKCVFNFNFKVTSF